MKSEDSDTTDSPQLREAPPAEGSAAPAELHEAAATPEVAPDSKPLLAADSSAPAPPFSCLVAWLLTLLGLGLPFILMTSDRRWIISPYVGVLGCGAAALGLMRLLGAFRLPASGTLPSTGSQLKPLALSTLSGFSFILAVRAAVAGVYPLQQFSAPIVITGCFLWLVTMLFRLAQSFGFYGPDATGRQRPLLERHGFWLVLLSTLLSLPGLGMFGLIDPWETHYGEVAREMLSRDDWISLWWAHDGWFWSKPILNFWLQGLSFKLFGVQYMPDQMLAGIDAGRWPQPEWACRLPIFAITLASAYALYRACIAPFGRRGALLGGLVLATCPYWYILARQTMADMPYVAPLCAAMAFLMLGFQTDPERRVRTFHLRLGRWSLPLDGFHLLFGAILLCLLPQVLYLFSRNLTFHTTELFGFRPHLDEILKGSGGGNCGQPGNKKCTEVGALFSAWWGQPALWGLVWLALGLGFLYFKRKERRLQRLFFIAAWLCTAIAVMAKGAPGLVLPVGAALVFVVVTGRFRDLLRLELPAVLVLLLAVAFPWYVQMFLRHGKPFIDRLILHDMVKRAFDQVHHTNEGDDLSFRYYVWQLGYGLFPWTGVCAGGLLWWATSKREASSTRSQATTFLLVWWLLAFGMFSITLTKFHHYIFPLVPPTAILAGVFLERYMPAKLTGSWGQRIGYVGTLFLGVTLLFLGVVAFLPGNLDAVASDGELPPAQRLLGIALALLGLSSIGVGIWRFGKSSQAAADEHWRNPALGALAIAAALGVATAGRDLFVTREGDVEGPARLLHLFTYNYDRPYPETLDFSPALLTLTILATTASLLLAWPRARRHAGVLLTCTAGLFSLWCMWIYLGQLAPHWGQRETMVAYYRHRAGPEEMLVAYQMNWKGENFYTGNRMATFVSTGKKFKSWVEKQRKQGVRTMFFTTEHTRVTSLKRELDKPEGFEPLTDESLNNKFFLAKVTFDPLPEKPTSEAKNTTKKGPTESKTGKGASHVSNSAP